MTIMLVQSRTILSAFLNLDKIGDRTNAGLMLRLHKKQLLTKPLCHRPAETIRHSEFPFFGKDRVRDLFRKVPRLV